MLNKRIRNVLERVNNIAQSNQEMFNIFQDVCYDFNIDKFALALFSGKKKITETFCVYDTYSKEWVQHYKEEKYFLCDPVFGTLKKVAIPFEWSSDNFDKLLPTQKKLMEEARDFGIFSGVTIPLIPHPTFHGFATVLNQPYLHPEVLYTLSLVANVCADKMSSMRGSQILATLTERETEILKQKAEGLTIKVISHNLGISESTSAFHLGNVRKKLDAHSTEHAVSKFTILMNQ